METNASPPFALLIPSNAVAKLFFDATCDSGRISLDSGLIHVDAQQKYDRDVLRFRLQAEVKMQDGATESDTATDPDTETEYAMKHCGMIWSGWFCFSLEPGPCNSTRGWTIGKGRRNMDVDYLLVPPPHWDSGGLRGYHARFNLHEKTGFLFVSKATSAAHAEVVVEGQSLTSGEQFALNRAQMSIRIGNLEFQFRYIDFAYHADFYDQRCMYMTDRLSYTTLPNINLTPTPSETFRCFGEWTMSRPLGKGAFGRVHSATNNKGDLVAIKIVERSERTANEVRQEVDILRTLESLTEIHEGDRKRILRLRDVIYQNGDEAYAGTVFEDVALVLEPAVLATFASITARLPDEKLKLPLDTPSLAELFHDALLGVNFLHSHNWIHGDLKPGNIGILYDRGSLHALLLDFGGAVNLPPGLLWPATPGGGGTVGYLAPEREMQAYDMAVDVWAMGVVGFELMHGYHPWRFALNPWRPGARYEALRPNFNEAYDKAVHKLRQHAGSNNHSTSGKLSRK